MAFLVQRFDLSDKSNLRVRQKLNAVVDAVNYLLRGGGGESGTVVYGTAMDEWSMATILVDGDHTTVTEDPTGTWTVNHDAVAAADAAKNTDYLSGLSSSGTQSSTGTTITLTAAKNTLQFDEFGHKAGSVAGTDDEVTFTVPDDLGDLYDTSVSSPDNGDLIQYNSTSGKWEKVSTATQTVVTGWRVNGTDIEIKTRSIKVIAAGDESAWTVAHAGTTCA